jgi:phosphoenolpyruvate-protein kinase (PTS system EI component)
MLARCATLPAVTGDGIPVRLQANLGKAGDADVAVRWNADGVGLCRTEFALDVRDRFPTEDEQVALLESVAERFAGGPVVFRLLDLGAEKTLPYFPLPVVANPALYLRGTRLLLQHPEVLRPQLRAILRTAERHPAAVLLPMVGGLEEVRAVRAIVAELRRELAAQGFLGAAAARLPFGAMIEVPSAALMAEDLGREVDFLSVGTNDLVQYLLAADRDEPGTAMYYRMLHPAVLRVLAGVVAGAARARCELTVCGEMAGDPFYTEVLLGLGVRSLSLAPRQLGAVRHEVRRCDAAEAADLVAGLLRLGTRDEVRAVVERRRANLELTIAGGDA